MTRKRSRQRDRSSSDRTVLLGAFIVVATLVAYIPAMSGGFVWDDDTWVTQNDAIKSLGGLFTIWFQPGALIQYYPLTFTSWWLDCHLFGLRPFGFHLENVLLHALCALLVWRVLCALEVRGAWLAAAVFALHPIHVESVAWITERKNVLSGVFYLGSLLTYLRFSQTGAGPEKRRPSPRGGKRKTPLPPAAHQRRLYVLSLVLFACALLSKTVTCSLPAAIVLLVWWKRGRLPGRDLLALVPMFALGIVMGLTTAWLERYDLGVEGPEWDRSFAEHLLVVGRVFCFYLGKLVWPSNLSFVYERWQIDSGVWWQYLYTASFAGVVVAFWLGRRRIGSGPLVAMLFFAGTLVPALGFFPVYYQRFSFVADHFVYLASIGPIALAAALVSWALAKQDERMREARRPDSMSPGRARRAVPPLAATAVLGLLATLTWNQGKAYANEETLWRDALSKHPSATLANYNLGVLLEKQGKRDEAMELYANAARANPHYRQPRTNLGVALLRKGRPLEAVQYLLEAVRINPNHFVTHHNLGSAYAQLGRHGEAVAHFEKALRLNPHEGPTHVNLGRVLAEQGELDRAITHYRRALHEDPGLTDGHVFLAAALVRQGRPREAAAAYRDALELRPRDADLRCDLGDLLQRQGETSQAVEQYQEALRIDPNHLRARKALANPSTDRG
jgi:tetratricopeptide (TPR) repeat protein